MSIERPEGAMDPQAIVQRLFVFWGQKSLGNDTSVLEEQIREQITLWGGVPALDAWMEIHDPNHSLVSTLVDGSGFEL